MMLKCQVTGLKFEDRKSTQIFLQIPCIDTQFTLRLTLLMPGDVQAVNIAIALLQWFPNTPQSQQHTFTIFYIGAIVYLTCFLKLTHFFF